MENPMVVYKKKWSEWSPNGTKEVLDEPIESKVVELPDEPDDDISDRGALIPVDKPNAKYAKILADKTCYVKIKENKAFWSGKCRPTTEEEHNFPPEIVAAIKPNGDPNWYFIDPNGQFCKRPENSPANVRTVCVCVMGCRGKEC
jgi:hypothetical protein